MGEGQNDGGVPGRRRVRPGSAAPGASDADGLEKLLADALRAHRAGGENRAGHHGRPGDGGQGRHGGQDHVGGQDPADSEGERQAVAAFRAARDAGVHRARTRRRDDWRPKEQRRRSRSMKTALSVAVASVTLGGVAVAGIGTVGSSSDAGKAENGKATDRPQTSAPARSGATPGSGSPSAKPDRPVTAEDTEAHCRAYEKVQGRGSALNSTAWQRLVEAAGGEDDVAAYCAEQLGQGAAAAKPTQSGTPGAEKSGKGADQGADQGTEKSSGKKKQ